MDGALHLTTDDVYQPPVYYPPDPTRRAGCAILREEVDLWRPARASYGGAKWVWPSRYDEPKLEASFNATFTMSANTSRHGVLPVAVITAIVFVAACFFLSRYRALRMRLKLSEVLRQLPGVPREFKHATIRKATHNFHEMMKLGRGGFGAVYKGTLRSGKRGEGRVDVAVKKFTRKDDRGYEDFLAEVDIIHRLRHKNIVPLLGWSYENGELLLIYEYMPNGSVDKHLFHEKQQHRGHQQPILPWERRYDIVKDVAAGLHYVHHEYERTVLHRDIKASNIMLDSAFRGRLGDFGLARVVAFDKNSFTDIGVVGTWGFMSGLKTDAHFFS